jgi:hypothetical protein
MNTSPIPFGRGPRLSQPARVTEGQVLELKNGLWDLQQEMARVRQDLEATKAELEHAVSALTHLDGEVFELKRRRIAPDPDPAPGIEPDWAARGEAWEQIVNGLAVYVSQGVTGNELAEMIGVAVLEVERRTGFDAGVQQ